MSLIEMSLSDVVKKQYVFKLNSFIGIYGYLAMMQLIGLLFSLAGNGGMGYSNDHFSINVSYYSSNMIIGFTIFWTFITSIFITTKATRYDDFSFVSNRNSANIANVLFLLTASIIGGISAVLSGYLLKVITYFSADVEYGISSGLFSAPKEFFLAISASILYALLFSAIGYFAGMIIQVNKVFVVLLPTLFFGVVIVGGIYNDEMMGNVINFIFRESVFTLFLLKMIGISGLLFTCAAALSNRMEVRR